MNDEAIVPGEIARASTVDRSSRTNLLASPECETLRDENRVVRLELDDLREENRRLRASTKQMRSEIMLLSRALEPMHRLSEALATSDPLTNRQSGADVAALRAQVDRLAQRLSATYASTSWRLTRPVRLLSRLLRGQRGADWPDP
jgi:hypothetical protein